MVTHPMGTPGECPCGHSALVPVLAEACLVSLSLDFNNDPVSFYNKVLFLFKLWSELVFIIHSTQRTSDVRSLSEEIRVLKLAWNKSSLAHNC